MALTKKIQAFALVDACGCDHLVLFFFGRQQYSVCTGIKQHLLISRDYRLSNTNIVCFRRNLRGTQTLH